MLKHQSSDRAVAVSGAQQRQKLKIIEGLHLQMLFLILILSGQRPLLPKYLLTLKNSFNYFLKAPFFSDFDSRCWMLQGQHSQYQDKFYYSTKNSPKNF